VRPITGSQSGLEFYRGNCRRGEQNAVDHCGNDGNFLPYSAIFCRIVQFLYYSDVDQIMRKSLLVSVFFGKKTLQKDEDMFLACPKPKVTIKLKFYYSNLKNAVETAKIAVDSCYVIRQFLTSLPSIDFREIRGLVPRHIHNHSLLTPAVIR
jgi:hypothetical protein